MFWISATAPQHNTFSSGEQGGLSAAMLENLKVSLWATPSRVLLVLSCLTVLPILASVVFLMYDVNIAGMNPAPLSIGVGLIGLGWLIGTNQTLDSSGLINTLSDIRALKMQRSNAALEKTLAATQTQLSLLTAERDTLEVQLSLDPLTGVQNRRGMEAAFAAHGTGTVLALLDIDHFKKINDTLGHDVGDRVLKDFARLLRVRLNNDLPIYRIGGEEFVIFFPQAQSAQVAAILNQFRADLNVDTFTRMNDRVSISFSAGLALCDDATQTFNDVFKVADKRLYDAKLTGRAKTVYLDETPCELVAAAG